MKICITGGAGFIAGYFHEALNNLGYSRTTLDIADAPERAGARAILGDVRDKDAVRAAVAGSDAVLHLAAAHHDFGISRDEYFAVNEQGSRVLCEVMEEQGVRRVCFFSSVAVYGDAPEPRTEETIPAPTSPYGQSKLAAEQVFKEWATSGPDRSCLVIRPTVTFGPHNLANMYSLIRQVHSGRFLPIGSGRNIKSLSYVENIVEATLFLMNFGGEPRYRAPFDIFNYIDKPDMTSKEIVDTIYEGLGQRPRALRVPLGLAVALAFPFDLVIATTGRNLPISSARLKKLCTQTKFEADHIQQAGFQANVPLRQGILRTVEWYLKEGRHSKLRDPATPSVG